MTKKQMIQAMLSWQISLCPVAGRWYAGDSTHAGSEDSTVLLTYTRNPAAYGLHHVAETPEEAVEDYCNARNLEWDT